MSRFVVMVTSVNVSSVHGHGCIVIVTTACWAHSIVTVCDYSIYHAYRNRSCINFELNN